MVKISSRDILNILRQYKVADDSNVPRQIDAVKASQPSAMNTLVAFRFLKRRFYILFDETAEDDIDYILSQIRSNDSNVKGQMISNPNDDSDTTYAIPFQSKECYLFEIISDKKRLDSELIKRYPELSRSIWQKHIKAGHVSVNHVVITSPSHDITDDDSMAVSLPDKPDYSENELPILYIDDNVIVVNKPTGVLSHSKDALNDEFTVAEFFRRYTTYNSDTNRPGIVHRLDRDTSGVMIGARNPETATLLQKQFADRKTKKTYIAITIGIPKTHKANIDLPIGRNPSAPSTFKVDSKGKPAQTQYEVIDSNNDCSLVELRPLTGRTHQLRVHMKYINTPILGDRLYGKAADRLYLHAYSLEITIPDGDRQVFVAPIPQEFHNIFPLMKL